MWLIALLSSLAVGQTTAAEWLAHIDGAAARANDVHLVLDVTLTDRHGAQAQRRLEVWQKGDTQRLVRLTAPARLAGTALLAPGGEELHLYLPAYDRVKRIVGERRGDAFVGTDFTLEDLARITFSDTHDGIVEATGDANQLLLTAKDGSGQMRLWARKDGLLTRIEHLKDGQVIRRVSMSDFRTVGGHAFAHKVEVKDVERNRTSVAIAQTIEVDTGIEDSVFAVTRLGS